MKKLFLLVLVGIILLGASSVPSHGDFYVVAVGGSSIGTPIISVPYTISQSGFYYLKGNFYTSGSAIFIQANDVTLDLMGFCLSGDGTGLEFRPVITVIMSKCATERCAIFLWHICKR